VPMQAVPTAAPQELLSSLLERMAPAGPRSRALVVDGGDVVGIVTPTDLARLIDVQRLARGGTDRTVSYQPAQRFSSRR
jgi:CBS domain-containing protein